MLKRGYVFFFPAEDGIRDYKVTWSSDVCSSDLPASASRLEYILTEEYVRNAGPFASPSSRPGGQIDDKRALLTSGGPDPRRRSVYRHPPGGRSEERRVGKGPAETSRGRQYDVRR